MVDPDQAMLAAMRPLVILGSIALVLGADDAGLRLDRHRRGTVMAEVGEAHFVSFHIFRAANITSATAIASMHA